MAVQRRSLLLLILLLASCSTAPPMPPYDARQAEETLVTALEAWKQGRVDQLAEHDPPIRFEDEDHRHGLQLADYRIELGERPVGPFDDIQVVLILRDLQGKTTETTAIYQVTLEPALAVLRND